MTAFEVTEFVMRDICTNVRLSDRLDKDFTEVDPDCSKLHSKITIERDLPQSRSGIRKLSWKGSAVKTTCYLSVVVSKEMT